MPDLSLLGADSPVINVPFKLFVLSVADFIQFRPDFCLVSSSPFRLIVWSWITVSPSAAHHGYCLLILFFDILTLVCGMVRLWITFRSSVWWRIVYCFRLSWSCCCWTGAGALVVCVWCYLWTTMHQLVFWQALSGVSTSLPPSA